MEFNGYKRGAAQELLHLPDEPAGVEARASATA
jgi:hypothetical protein